LLINNKLIIFCMLNLNEIKTNKIIQISNEPYIVIKAEHHKTGRGGAVLKTKLRNLISNNILDKTFQGNDKAEDVEIENKKANFLYKDDVSAFFMDNETYEQFDLPLDQIGEKQKFLKENTDIDVLYFAEKPVSINLPIKMEFQVIDAPPAIKGNSVGNITKQIKLETGAVITAPIFVKKEDVVRVNTETGEYVERA
ncbi:elongation factor P, partial [Patescibacteria group bacterium]|nr:elongation factor P [Patescibacteria group bacterium]